MSTVRHIACKSSRSERAGFIFLSRASAYAAGRNGIMARPHNGGMLKNGYYGNATICGKDISEGVLSLMEAEKTTSNLKKDAKRTTRLLVASFFVLIAICIGSLSLFASTIGRKSEDAINKIGEIYMSGMNEKTSLHFETTIMQQLEQLESIIENNPPQDFTYSEAMLEELTYESRIRDFDYLALMGHDGSIQMVCGEAIHLADPDPFVASMKNKEKKVAVGETESGETVVMLGISAAYPMENGRRAIAIVAGIPADYIDTLLSLDSMDSLTYSHIIRRDGTFVIKSAYISNHDYFSRMLETYEDFNGKTPEQYVSELQAAMERNENYSTIFMDEGERRHLHCTRLPYSEWYLITIMPYGALDETLSALNSERSNLLLLGVGITFLVLFCIFILYYRNTRNQLRALEAARLDAIHANKAKSEFLSNMSHDIRTPMNAIVGMTAIATANINNTQQVQNCLKKITLSSKHLLGLINDVLDMSKIESGKLTLTMDQVSLREVFDSIVNIVQPQVKLKHQQFDVFIHDIETENVYCDSVRINQVLLNFLSNAIKFTPEGGSITLSMYEEPSPLGEDYVRMQVFVKDTGIGMSEEFQKRIFESFVREDTKRVHKTEGSGLGMAITKYIVDAMGGTIEVHSELGKGTKFHVTLDLEKATVPEEEMILPDWHMLVVDDDIQLCESTVGSLQQIGVVAEWALDGETALEMVEHRHIKHDDYHIILLDWKLPGIDGIETAKRIRQKMGTDVPILLISAYDCTEIEEQARDAGISGFISKPLFKSTLFYGLRQFTGDIDSSGEQNHAVKMDFNGTKVLIAEDNDLNWEIAAELLAQYGLDLERAENGHICVEMFSKSAVGYYAAILMDIRMPIMTGYEATEEIRKLDRPDANLPIIAMTADAFSEDIQKSLACGMNAHVSKPIDTREVARLLEKFIYEQQND